MKVNAAPLSLPWDSVAAWASDALRNVWRTVQRRQDTLGEQVSFPGEFKVLSPAPHPQHCRPQGRKDGSEGSSCMLGAGVGRALRKRTSTRGEALTTRNRKAQDEAEDKPWRPSWDFLWLRALPMPFTSVSPPDIEGCCFLFWLNML